MKHELRIMSPEKGDAMLEWTEEDFEAVSAAKTAFDQAQREGMVLYEVAPGGGDGAVLKQFKPEAGRIIGMPFPVGG